MNGSHSAQQVTVSSHYNKREQQTRAERTESPIYALRCINNWIKSVLIRDHVAPDAHVDVLDLCGGRGGDLLKWARCGARSVLLVDFAQEEINRARERWQQQTSPRLHTSVDFACADAFSPMPQLRDNAFDVVSCQFALHYAFEKSAAVQAVFENVSRALKPGGVFICTFPDSERVINYCFRDRSDKRDESVSGDKNQSGSDENEGAVRRKLGCGVYSNSICRVEFDDKTNDIDAGRLPVFSSLYYFTLGDAICDCPEYLVKQEVLLQEAKIAGLELVRTQTFDDLCHDAVEKKQEHADLWQKMVQRQPSLDEWDVVCLYRACVFVRQPDVPIASGYGGERRSQVSYEDCWHTLPGFEDSRFVFSGSEQTQGPPIGGEPVVRKEETADIVHIESDKKSDKESDRKRTNKRTDHVSAKKRKKPVSCSEHAQTGRQEQKERPMVPAAKKPKIVADLEKGEHKEEHGDEDREEDREKVKQVLARKPAGAIVYRGGSAVKKGARVKAGDSFEHNGHTYVKGDGSGWHLAQ